MLGLGSKADQWPVLKTKAASTGHIGRWMAATLASVSPADNEMRLVRNVVVYWDIVYQIIKNSGDVLADSTCDKLLRCHKIAMNSYSILSRHASEQCQRRWPMKPKFHLLDEIIRETATSKINCRQYWCFKHEDFIGVIVKVAKRCHTTTMCRKVLLKWRMRLQLKLMK